MKVRPDFIEVGTRKIRRVFPYSAPLGLGVRQPKEETADHRHPGLLRPYRQRPHRRRGAEEREEGAAVHGCSRHSITSSAMASNVGGIVKLSNFAVCMLITNSNLVG